MKNDGETPVNVQSFDTALAGMSQQVLSLTSL